MSPPHPRLLNCFLPRHQWQTTPRSGRSGRSSHVPFQSCPAFYSPGTVGLVMEDMSFLKVGLGDEWQPIEVDGRVSWWILLGRVGPLTVD